MRVVPKTVGGKIGFYAAHLPKWAQDPAAIGATPEQIAALQEILNDARTAFIRQRQAQNAARAATLALHSAVKELAGAGGRVIMRVHAKAASSDGAVYNAAFIPPPRKRSPIAPPGTPSSFSFELSGVGSVTLRWKCKNPRGSASTMYRVWRQAGPTGEFVVLGVTGAKRFLDATVPSGVESVTYQVRAERGKKVGPISRHTIHFGVSAAHRRMAASELRRLRTVQTSGPSEIAA